MDIPLENTKLKNIDSIIFDLDGTLWDASATCTKAWNETLRQSGNENFVLDEKTIRSFTGLRIEKVLSQYFYTISEDKHVEFLDLYKKNEAFFMRKFGGQLYPDVKKGLNELRKKYKLFIVSNCLSGYIENFIQFNELQNIFSDFESWGNTGLSKSENIKLVIERNKLSSSVYVGDTIWDYEASMNNKIPFIYAAYGFGNISDPAYKIDEFKQLSKLFPSPDKNVTKQTTQP